MCREASDGPAYTVRAVRDNQPGRRPDMQQPQVKGFFDKRTYSIQYVVADPATKKCAIIDPVLDFDEKSGATATINADAILDYVRDEGSRGRVDPRHASACRPFLGRAVSEGKDRRAEGHRPEGDRGAEAVEGHLQLARLSGRRLAVGPHLRRRRDVHGGLHTGAGDVLARSYAGLDHLCDRRRRLRARHAVHARQRHGARRLSRRQRQRGCGSRSRRSWRCPTRRASSPATTTSRTVASRCGNRRSPSRRRRTRTSRPARPKADVRGVARGARQDACRCPS